MTELAQSILCPECDLPVPQQAPGGLCPACLLREVLGDSLIAMESKATDTDHSINVGSTLGPKPSSEARPAEFALPPNSDQLRYFGDYELHSEIARGGMGVVYRARQMRLNRLVALKMIRTGKYSSVDDIQRLRVEAEAAAQLDHPAIVPVFECGEHEGLHYFTMAFVEGQTLSDRIGQGPLPAREAAELMLKVAHAIAYAHAKGVIHRDIKPGNILLDGAGQPRITDFGLAKQVSSESDLTTTGQILGTPSYMPPEQAQGRIAEIGAAADIYSMGAVLYATLTGRPPFQAQTSVDTLRLVVEELPLSPRLFDPTIPVDLETICLKCLEKSIARRYGSARELADELNRYLSGEPIVARPVAIARRMSRWYRRHWAAATLGVCVVAMIGAISATLALTNRQLKQELVKTEKAETEAAEANRAAQAQLWVMYSKAASAKHRSRLSGQRFGALRAIDLALKLPTPNGHSLDELRTEAIAAICLPDMEIETTLPHNSRVRNFAIDKRKTLYGVENDASDQYVVRNILTNKVELSLPAAEWQFEYSGPEFSPDSSLLVYPKIIDGQPVLHLWRIGQEQPVANLGAGAASIDFSPDSQRCAVAERDGTIRVLNLTSMTEDRRINTGLASGPVVVWNPTLDQIVVMNSQHWQVIDVNSGEKIRELEEPKGFDGWPTWHPSGKLLSIPTRVLGISVWDVASGRSIAPPIVGHRRGGTIAAFSPSGDHLVSNDWGQLIRLWDWRSGQQLLSMPASGVQLNFSSDGHLLADCATDKIGIIRFTERTGARAIWESSLSSNFRYLHCVPCINRTGRLFATKIGNDVGIVDLVNDEIVARLPLGSNGPLRFREVDGHETLWTYGTSGLMEWPLTTESASESWGIGPPRLIASIQVENIWSTSRDGRLVLVPTSGGGVLYDTVTHHRKLLSHPPDVRSSAVSPDGKVVVTGSHSFAAPGAIVWNGDTGEKIVELPVSAGGACISPDGKWLCTNGGGIRLWEIGQWNEARLITPSMANAIFSPDSQLLAVSDDLSRVRLISTKTAKQVAVLTSPERTRLILQAFTPDGEQLVTCGEDTGALHIFDLREIRQQLAEMGLDWDAPSFPPDHSRQRSAPQLKFTVNLGNYAQLVESQSLNKKAQNLFAAGKSAEALAVWQESVRLMPDNAKAHNQIAWVLSVGPIELRDTHLAVDSAIKAVEAEPENFNYLNTLGVALYRDGQWRESIRRLNQSVNHQKEPDAYDGFFLAMAHWQLDEKQLAQQWLDRAIKWMDIHEPNKPELQAFRHEAEELMVPVRQQ